MLCLPIYCATVKNKILQKYVRGRSKKLSTIEYKIVHYIQISETKFAIMITQMLRKIRKLEEDVIINLWHNLIKI